MGELLNSLSSLELAEWMAYDKLEPFGELRDDYRAALICHTLYQINASKDSPKLNLEDFLIRYGSGYYPKEEVVDVKNLDVFMEATFPNGSITSYSGDAPAIKRWGKKAKKRANTKHARRIREILYGKKSK